MADATSPLYPTDFPAKELQSLVTSTLSSGDSAVLAYNLWVVLGYGLSKTVGDPNNLSIMSVTAEPDGLDGIRHILAVHEAQQSGTPLPQSLPLPVDQLLQWAVKELIKLLQQEAGLPTT